ncbi:transglycosylase SLT domain-containing protein [Pseudodesulfovibrio sp. JC047]|nr:transglycosylase SLT domain-containing protein [Pseudodesulfovibrio sp. JC047]
MFRRHFDLWLAVFVALAALLCWMSSARALDIPDRAYKYRSTLIRCARVEWGLAAPVATFAAQLHQESLWRADAKSPVGAGGLAQFMPPTANWLPEVAPQVGKADPFNPGWALRALTAYDLWLWKRIQATTGCDRMAMTLSAYNGGLGWLRRDVRLTKTLGLNPRLWWKHVETVNAGRAKWAIKENRGYPRRILFLLEPLYEKAGWGKGVCP